MDTAQRTAAALGVDFGTHNTVATVLRADGRRHQLLFEGNPLLPSGIYLDYDASLLVGRDAAREGRRHPERYERNPKLRIDSPSILLGDREVATRDAVAAVIGRALSECGRVAGPPRAVTVTVPAGWGPARRHVIGDAAASAGTAGLTLLPEPVAAARYFVEVLGHDLPPGQAVVVFDLGAGTFDASVVARTDTGYEVLAVDGSDRIGGHYLDQALVEYLGGRYEAPEETARRWRSLLDPNSGPEQRRLRFALHDEVRDAKERLSRTVTTEIAVPGFAHDELLTRSELELLARPLLEQTVAITKAVIREAGCEPGALAGIFMVGGASRMPLAATMLHREFGVAPTLIEEPELVVSEGAVSVPAAPAPPTAVMAAPMSPTGVTDPAAPMATRILPAGPVPQRHRAGRWLMLAAIALAVAVAGGGTSLIYSYANQPDATFTVGGPGSEAPSGDTTTDSEAVGEASDGPAEFASITLVDTESTASSITVHTDASADLTGCSVVYSGTYSTGAVDDLGCAEIVIEGLDASDTYTVEVYGPGQDSEDPDADPVVTGASTTPLFGQVYWDCPQTRTYCQDQGGEPGIRGDHTDRSSTIGYAPVGEIFELTCYEVAETITPRGEEPDGYWDYHPGKRASDLMIQIEYGDTYGYLPFVWLVIDPDDLNSTGDLAPC